MRSQLPPPPITLSQDSKPGFKRSTDECQKVHEPMKLSVKFCVHVYFLEKRSPLMFSWIIQEGHDSNKRLRTPAPDSFLYRFVPHSALTLPLIWLWVSNYLNGEVLAVISLSAYYKIDSTTLFPWQPSCPSKQFPGRCQTLWSMSLTPWRAAQLCGTGLAIVSLIVMRRPGQTWQ